MNNNINQVIKANEKFIINFKVNEIFQDQIVYKPILYKEVFELLRMAYKRIKDNRNDLEGFDIRIIAQFISFWERIKNIYDEEIHQHNPDITDDEINLSYECFNSIYNFFKNLGYNQSQIKLFNDLSIFDQLNIEYTFKAKNELKFKIKNFEFEVLLINDIDVVYPYHIIFDNVVYISVRDLNTKQSKYYQCMGDSYALNVIKNIIH